MREITVPEVVDAVERLTLRECDTREGAAPSTLSAMLFLCFDGDEA